MLQAFRTARSVPGKELLRLIEEHALACEEYGEILPQVWSRVSKLTATLRADLRGSGFKEQVAGTDTQTSGIFSDFLSSLGVSTDASPGPQAAFAPPGSGEPAENAASLGAVLEHLEQGPGQKGLFEVIKHENS